MGYLGLTPTTAQQNYLNIDDISGSFNGTTTSFALQVGGVAPVPFPVTNSCLISVGGVVQQPDDTGTDGFRISGGNIIFSSAPGTGEDFFGLVLAGADYLNVGANFPDGTVGTPSITFESDLNTGIYHPSADSIAITSGGTAALTVDSNQRVGIGTTSPGDYASNANKLVISETGNSGLTIATGSSSNGHIFFADGTTGDQAYRGIIKYEHGNDAMTFGTAGGNERARIDSSGRLLVGTSSSSGDAATNSQLVVAGSSVNANGALALTRNSANPSAGQGIGQIFFADSNGGRGAAIQGQSDGTWGSSDYPGRLVFFTTADAAASPTERLRIAQSGAFGLSGANYGTSGQFLQSQGSGSAPQWASAGLPDVTSGGVNGAGSINRSVPSGTQRITIVFYGVSTASGSGRASVNLGQSGGLVYSGYQSANVYVNAGSGIYTRTDSWVIWNPDANISWSGTCVLTLTDGSSLWAANWTGVYDTTSVYAGGGTVNISNVTQVEVGCLGIGQFDGGTIGFYFE